LERSETFFFVLKSLVPTQSSQDKEKLSCPFQSTDNFPEWKLAFTPDDFTRQVESAATQSGAKLEGGMEGVAPPKYESFRLAGQSKILKLGGVWQKCPAKNNDALQRQR
jgi:hypothetical protein